MKSMPSWVRFRSVGAGLVVGVLGILVVSGRLAVWQSRIFPASEVSAWQPPAPPEVQPPTGDSPPRSVEDESRHVLMRREMVERQLRTRDITDAKILEVMGRVPRHRFVPEEFIPRAYADHPLPIGRGQTISQPYIVALMTQLASPRREDRALDIGTGSGYQAAVLAELCKEVYSIEIVESLGEAARKRLAGLEYKNVTVRCGDGYRGWKERAPFDVIVVAAAPERVPQPLVDQLAPGGRLVVPVGGSPQRLMLITRQTDGTVRFRAIAPVMFVPMTGEAEQDGPSPKHPK